MILLDAVGPCPPLYQATHSGCHFDPMTAGPAELLALACCCGLLVTGAAIITALVLRARREKSSREP